MEGQKINWIQAIGTFVSVSAVVVGAMLWVNSEIVELRTKMDEVQKADYKSDLKELRINLEKQLGDYKSDQRERDKSQWESIQRKADKR